MAKVTFLLVCFYLYSVLEDSHARPSWHSIWERSVWAVLPVWSWIPSEASTCSLCHWSILPNYKQLKSHIVFWRLHDSNSDHVLSLYISGVYIFLRVWQIYHCNVNSVGRICHSIFDRSYNAHITMREIFDAVYGLLIIPEPDDPLDRWEMYTFIN